MISIYGIPAEYLEEYFKSLEAAAPKDEEPKEDPAEKRARESMERYNKLHKGMTAEQLKEAWRRELALAKH